MNNEASNVDKIALINGLRGFAIIGVILHHSFFDQFRYGVGHAEGAFPFALLMSSGWLGVNLFFFLSGFVLFLPYAGGKRRMESVQHVGEFYRRRFLRLVPLYTFIWILSLVLISGLQLDGKRIYIAALTYASFLYPFHPETFFPPANPIMWSIGLEIWFSVLFPALMLALGKFGWRRVLPVVLLISVAVRCLGQLYTPAPQGQVLNFVSDSVLGRLDEFVLGMLAAHLYQRRRALPPGWFVLGLVLMVAAILAWAGWYHGLLPRVTTAVAVNLLDAGMLICVLHLLCRRERLGQALSSAWLQLLGCMCYSIYLWHGLVRDSFRPSFTAGVFEYGAYLAAVFALSFITYRYIEFGSVRSWKELVPAMQERAGRLQAEAARAADR